MCLPMLVTMTPAPCSFASVIMISAMMRALCQPFDFILADEPISHLDDNNSRIMGEIMMREAKEQGAGVIVTSIGKHMDLNYEHIFRL